MNIRELDLPDTSGHPPPPRLTFEQYQRWICGEIGPMLALEGKFCQKELLADFMKNESRQNEEWPDFGADLSKLSQPDPPSD